MASMTAEQLPPAIRKRAHKEGCHGALYRKPGTVCIDRTGRIGNGSWVAHVYECNRAWDNCPAKVVVTEVAVRNIAVSVEA